MSSQLTLSLLECLVLVCRSWSTHPAHVESIDTVTAGVSCLGMSMWSTHPAHVESIDTVTAWSVLSWYVDRGAHIRHMSSQLTLSLLGVSCLGMSIVEHTSGTCRVN